jgi:hypothetical protein
MQRQLETLLNILKNNANVYSMSNEELLKTVKELLDSGISLPNSLSNSIDSLDEIKNIVDYKTYNLEKNIILKIVHVKNNSHNYFITTKSQNNIHYTNIAIFDELNITNYLNAINNNSDMIMNIDGTYCPLCLDYCDSNNIMVLLCKHYSCIECVSKTLETQNKCPTCRVNLF